MEGSRKRGRPKGTTDPDRAHKRTVAFPPGLYARLMEIADREERDVTSQIVKVLRDFVAEYDKKEADRGNTRPMLRAA